MLLLLRVFHVEQMLCACTLFAVLAVFGAVAPHGAVTPWEFGHAYGGYRAVSVGVAWLARWQFFGGRASAFAGVRFRPPRPSTPSVARLRPRLVRPPAVGVARVRACAPPSRVGLRPCAVPRPAVALCAPALRCPSRVRFFRCRPCESARPSPLYASAARFLGSRGSGCFRGCVCGILHLYVCRLLVYQKRRLFGASYL